MFDCWHDFLARFEVEVEAWWLERHPSFPRGREGVVRRPWCADASRAPVLAAHLAPLMHRAHGALGLPAGAWGEQERIRCAALLWPRLAIPTFALREAVKVACDDLFQLCDAFPWAHPRYVALRLLDFPTPRIISVFENSALRDRVANFSPFPALLDAEREGREYAHRFSRPRAVSFSAGIVRVWPWHDPEWRHEIVSTVCDR